MKQFLLVLLAGALFSASDVIARKWGQERLSGIWFVAMALSGTMSYAVFGLLTRSTEFSRAVIWVSLALTAMSCMIGILWMGDSLTWTKGLALALALTAAYLSVL